MKLINLFDKYDTYYKDFIARCTYHSNAIEGNTLSFEDTYSIIWCNDSSCNKITTNAREFYEVINHRNALDFVIECAKNKESLSEDKLQSIVRKINENIAEISGYRKTSVYINGAEYIPPEPNRLNQLMMYFVYNYNNTQYYDVYEKIAKNHIEFERIHPFSDGNGRTGRLLINFELLSNNKAPVIIDKDYRYEYFEMIAKEDIKRLAKLIKELSYKEFLRIQDFVEDEDDIKVAEKAYAEYLKDPKTYSHEEVINMLDLE